MSSLFRAATILLVVFACLSSSCVLGYRHTRHASTYERDDGRSITTRGHGNAAQLGAALDFRYFRFMIPFELVRRELRFEADDGAADATDYYREKRILRLDVPVLSLWNAETGGIAYPGLLRHRESVELWVSGEGDFSGEPVLWADVGVVYYNYNGVGVRLYGGYGSIPFRASTQVAGSRFPATWDGRANQFGGGVELTFTAGEYGLEVIEWLIDFDERHRRRTRQRRQ